MLALVPINPLIASFNFIKALGVLVKVSGTGFLVFILLDLFTSCCNTEPSLTSSLGVIVTTSAFSFLARSTSFFIDCCNTEPPSSFTSAVSAAFSNSACVISSSTVVTAFSACLTLALRNSSSLALVSAAICSFDKLLRAMI